MALDLKRGERVSANCGYLQCPHCDSGMSATYYPNKGYAIYTSHHKVPTSSECRAIVGSHIPDDAPKMKRVIKYGFVAKDNKPYRPGKGGRHILVRWDGEEPSYADIFDLSRVTCDCGVSKGLRSDHEGECKAAYLQRPREVT